MTPPALPQRPPLTAAPPAPAFDRVPVEDLADYLAARQLRVVSFAWLPTGSPTLTVASISTEMPTEEKGHHDHATPAS